jgi:WD40 repeat protein
VRYSPTKNQQKIVRQTVLWEEAPVIALEYLTRHQLLISALQNGQIKFYRWPKLTPLGMISAPEERLTSLQISPDGSFMATGTSDSSMLLWDLRMLDLPDLVDLPLAKATPDHLAAINTLLGSPTLPAALQPPLNLLKALLIRRFRFDIQVDDLPQIQPGEFDILLD